MDVMAASQKTVKPLEVSLSLITKAANIWSETKPQSSNNK